MSDMTFDPWPAIYLSADEIDHLNLTELQRLQIEVAREVQALEGTLTSGAEVLDATVRCIGTGIPAPPWLRRQFMDRMNTVRTWRVESLDDAAAFGPRASGKGRSWLQKKELQARVMPTLNLLFGSGRFKRTDQGYKAAAKFVGISPRQVKDWLQKTRKNGRGHRPHRAETAPSALAHDPFGLGRKV